MHLLERALDFFIHYGYYFLFLATALENIPVIGLFLPGEAVVVAAGFLASSGEFELWLVILIASLGAVAGSAASYIIGWFGGRALIELIALKLKADHRRLGEADTYFHSHGPVTVFIGRYMTGVKAFIPALAGTHRMNFAAFLFFASLGVVSWTVLAAFLGFFFGEHWTIVLGIVQAAGWVILLAVVLILAVIWFRRKRAAQGTRS
jgi:membrane protein DedA with SNARE-associated domain